VRDEVAAENPSERIIAPMDVPVEQLVPHPGNPRKGNIAAVRESIREHGWHGILVAQKARDQEPPWRILVGKHRWEAAKAEGYASLPVQFKDVDDLEALRIVLADNRASDLAGYDNDALLQNLKDIGYVGTLFTLDDVETLQAGAGAGVEAPAFAGDYADAGEEMEARKAAAERIGQEMKDVVLVMKPADYAQYQADLKVLQKRWDMNGAIATTIAAVHRAALEEGDLGDLKTRVEKMREWGNRLIWAVSHDDKVEFGELFGVVE
jgi:hypothetical protein